MRSGPTSPGQPSHRRWIVSDRVRRFAATALLALCSAALALGAVEAALRWRFGQPPPLDGEVLDLKALGFRYGIHSLQKDPMTIRVVGIGDSFAFAPVEPPFNYHRILEDKLSRKLARPVEVINLGRPGVGPAAELAILRDLGLRFDPDLVLWMFFTGNDFLDDAPGASHTLEAILGSRSWEDARMGGEGSRWYNRLRLAGYIRFLATLRRHADMMNADPESHSAMHEIAFMRVEKRRMAFLLDRLSVETAYELSVRPRLEQAIRMCRGQSIPFVLAIAPDQAQIEGDLARSVLSELHEEGRLKALQQRKPKECLERGDLMPLTIAHDLLATLAEEGAIVVDLYEPFREAGTQGGLYLERHTHWNREGNRLAAEILADPLATILCSARRSR